MENKILKGFDVDRLGGNFYYNLILNLKEKYDNLYPKAFGVCGYYNFSEMGDIETYIERAMEYIAEVYQLDLDFDIEQTTKGKSVRIYLTDTNETLIEGTIIMMKEVAIYHFNENVI